MLKDRVTPPEISSAEACASLIELLRFRAGDSSARVVYTFLGDGETVKSTLSYGELDRQARVIGGWLRSLGRPGDRVLLAYPPGLEFAGAFFGCLYAGMIAVPAYLPKIDRSLVRLLSIVKDAEAGIALTTSEHLSKLRLQLAQVSGLGNLQLHETDPIISSEPEYDIVAAPDPESLAMLQYTSGSTGMPKGVMLTHGNLLHNARIVHTALEHTTADRYVTWLPTFHDMGFMAGVLQPLFAGIEAVSMPPGAFLQSPIRWLRAISKYRATISGGPNFAYDLCVRRISLDEQNELDLQSWSIAFNGAEPVRYETMERFASRFESCSFRQDAFFPCYGLAEATLMVSGSRKLAPLASCQVDTAALENNRISEPRGASQPSRRLVSSGRVDLGQDVIIIKPDSLTLCNPDEVGEIWVSGPSVAKGYWNQPDETENTFSAHLTDTAKGPFLRSGDVGFLDHGQLYVTGRVKDLIIIRGRNLYPQDIEATVQETHRALRPGCGAAFSVDLSQEEKLIIVQEVDGTSLDTGKVIGGIRKAVAETYEASTHAVVLIKAGTIPKTSSGKIQRRMCRSKFLEGSLDVVALDVLNQGNDGDWLPFSREDLVSIDPNERESFIISCLREQIASVVRVNSSFIDPMQPLNELGLDSLLSLELKNRVERVFAVPISMTSVLEGARISDLARDVANQIDSSGSLILVGSAEDAEYAGTVPLSYGQQALWFLYELAPRSPAYNIAAAVRIRNELNVGSLQRAFETLVKLHPTLRASFSSSRGEPAQYIREELCLPFHHADVSSLSDSSIQELLIKEAYLPFDLEHDALLRISLLSRTSDDHILLITAHHIIVDLLSLAILLDQLRSCYEADLKGEQARLTYQHSNYYDFVRWQREVIASPQAKRSLDYWREHLGGELPVLNLPTDRPRPHIQTYKGASQFITFGPEINDRLALIARDSDSTLFIVLLGALAVLLHKYSRQDDLIIGYPTTGRSRAAFADMVGYFVNPLVVRIDVSGNLSFDQLLAQVRKRVLDGFEHQDIPFSLIVDRLRPERQANRSPIFQVMFTFQKTTRLGDQGLAALALGEDGARMQLGPLNLESIHFAQRVAQFDLTLMMAGLNGSLGASLQYNTDLFNRDTIRRMAEHFKSLLEAICSNPFQRISSLPLLTESERHHIIVSWNNTGAVYESSLCIHNLVEARVRENPDSVAVVSADNQVSYSELDRRANQLALNLQSFGIGPEVAVGVFIDRSADLLVALLAVLKAGGFYVPLDPTHPIERTTLILEDARVPLLITTSRLSDRVPRTQAQLVFINDDAEEVATHTVASPAHTVVAENISYTIYTSGSTGKPKGVQISHTSVVNFLMSMAKNPGLEASDRLFSVTTLSFDISALEFFLPLIVGGVVILAEGSEIRDGYALMRRLDSSNATVMQATPATWRLLLEAGWAGNKGLKILCGGEAFGTDLGTELAARAESAWNMYGPTETTIWSLIRQLKPDDTKILIGMPIGNTKAYLLDDFLEPVPIGVSGELYISGAGLARCYFNQPELTAEKFMPNPFCKAPGERCYRTGDFARFKPDGHIQFLGRSDSQVKIRGFRIELGEIELALGRHPAVKDAAAVVREARSGEKTLVAYLVPKQNATPDKGELRSYLKQKLPEYMMPSGYVFLEALPQTPSGKVSRKTLPTPECHSNVEAPVDPRSPVTEVVNVIWAEVLDLEQIGIHANFFDIGGNSLLAAKAVSRLRDAFHIELPVAAVFECPTVVELVARIEEDLLADRHAVLPPAVMTYEKTGIYPLSFAQQRLWFLDQLEPGNCAYSVPGEVALLGPLNLDCLRQSLIGIINRHDPLRATFDLIDGKPAQTISDYCDVELDLIDLRGVVGPDRQERLSVEIEAEARKPFNLKHGPLLRARLFLLAEHEHKLLIIMHHIVCDGWSLDVFLSELQLLYDAFKNGRAPSLPSLPMQYVSFIYWQREWLQGTVFARLMQYWRDKLSGDIAVLQLPFVAPQLTPHSFNGDVQSAVLPHEVVAGLKALSRHEHATLFMTLVAAFNTLLYRYTGQEDVLIGTPVANRNWPQVEGLIACFVNTLVLRTNLSGTPGFRQLLGRVRTVAIEAYAHQDLPFERLVEELRPNRDTSGNPFFQVMVGFNQVRSRILESGGLTLLPKAIPGVATQFMDLILNVDETEDGVTVSFEYNISRLDPDTITRMLGHFETLLTWIVANPDASISAIPILTEDERRFLIEECNNTSVQYPRETCLHNLVESSAQRNPDAIAFSFEGCSVTYGEANGRANQLAHHLMRLGVASERFVGLCMEQTPDMVIGILGILKSGGAYVPLDPEYPKERLTFVLHETQPVAIVSQSGFVGHFAEFGGELVCLDRDWPVIGLQSDGNPISGVTGQNLAYVIHTSGSTGRPKGVMVPHRGVCNYIYWMQESFPLGGSDRLPQKYSFMFDAAVSEIFHALLGGARLLMVSPGQQQNVTYLVQLIKEQQATCVDVVPSLLNALLEVPDFKECKWLRRITCGSEVLPLELPGRLFLHLNVELYNLYGPTEGSIGATSWRCRPEIPGKSAPIGRAVSNLQLYVLDRDLQVVPVGVPGELHIGGVGVTRGYLEHPELTAEKFIPDPFSSVPAERLYKTGDLVRYLEDGNVEFIGRVDHQLKIRGFRIETGEVEAVLRQHPSVRDTIVLAGSAGTGDRQLLAYVTLAGQSQSISAELRSFLQQRLPGYMVPAAIIALDSFPLTPGGKVDRHRLPAADQIRAEFREFITPRTAVEETILEVWQDVLGLDQISVNDDFFELGGHSLLIAQVLFLIKDIFQVELPMRSMFTARTVEELAKSVVALETRPGQMEHIAQLLHRIQRMSAESLAETLHEKRAKSVAEG